MLRAYVANYPRSTAVVVFIMLWLIWPRGQSPLHQGEMSGPKCSKVGKRYGVMFDAGSTGSRVHVYHFVYAEDGSVTLTKELFEQLKPGLSSYADEPERAAQSLVPLIDKALADIPKDAMACVPVALKATAGLRLTGEEKSKRVLEAVRKKFAEYPFRMGKDSVVVMDGADEGPFAWLTVNFLLGTLNPASATKTAGIIDLGGGSTQLVFEPQTHPEALAKGPKRFAYDVAFLGRKFRTYQNSYLGFGLKEAEKRTMKAWVDSDGKASSFPCFPAGYTHKVPGTDVTLQNEGDTNFASCLNVAKTLFNKKAACEHDACSFNGVFQPSITKNFRGDLLAFSYYYDRLEPWLPEDKKVSVKMIADLGERVCGGDLAEQHNKEMACLDFAYLYSLVSHGYELPDHYTLRVLKKINGVETAWCLGAMILEM